MDRKAVLVATTITIFAVVVFAITLARATLYSPASAELSPPETKVEQKDSAGVPIRLRIETAGVAASVQRVGIAPSGNMAVPSNYTDVGWYRAGTVPGERGSAVMDGHVDNGLGAPAVFARLGDLQKGDEIFVDTVEGSVRFVVEEVVVYEHDEVPLERVFNRADRARLNLITCDGVWIEDKKTYDSRLVVYAVRAP